MRDRFIDVWVMAGCILAGFAALSSHTKRPVVAPAIQVVDTLSDSEKRDELVVLVAVRYGVDTALALDVSHAENWTGNPRAISPAGAIGLMQVMPFWRGAFPECGEDLFNSYTNVCYGILILSQYLRECGNNTFCATNRYNGARRTADILSYQSEIGRARGRRSGS